MVRFFFLVCIVVFSAFIVAKIEAIEKRVEKTSQEAKSNFPQNNIILEFGIGTAIGGIYTRENQYTNALGVSTAVPNGSQQSADATIFTLVFGINYQAYESERWSTLLSYLYRSQLQRINAGKTSYCGQYCTDTSNFKHISDSLIVSLHTLLIGKEIHLYPGSGFSSFDLLGQVGYDLGSYYPYAGYNSLISALGAPNGQTQITTAPTSVFVHGPTARVGVGMTGRFWYSWQFRFNLYYQLTYLFSNAEVWPDIGRNSFVHDIHLTVSIGYGF